TWAWRWAWSGLNGWRIRLRPSPRSQRRRPETGIGRLSAAGPSAQRPGLQCISPPSAKIVAAVM
ncbi:MAG: hypothetical protein ACK55I_45720, partial [bacterium]